MNRLAAGAIPLDDEQTNRLHGAVSDLSPSQLQWVSGYAAGLAAASGDTLKAPVDAEPGAGSQLTVLYGSQTGNGEGLAGVLSDLAREQGYAARSVSLADFKPASLKRESLVTFIVSTHGEGEPPDDAELLYEYLMSDKAPRLPELRYSVLALGDSSYVNYCQTGREFDRRLAELGARRFGSFVECDLDYAEAAAAWSRTVIAELPGLLGAVVRTPRLRAVDSVAMFDVNRPFSAEVLVNQKITGAGSSKDVRHIELSLEGSGLHYEPGDSLAVIADNPPELVDELLLALGLKADAEIVTHGETAELRQALVGKLEITAVNLGFLRAWTEISGSSGLKSVLDDKRQLADLLETHQVIDIVRRYPGNVDAQVFVDALRTLSPRSYSISSSQNANPDEVHLTVAAVRYEAFGTRHWGAASTHLADRIEQGDKVSIYVEPNKRFRLPEPERPIIMIGPGTGVAPFRAFVEERVEQAASGKNWLIFGDRNFESDFLYQLEWQRYLKQGHLARLDVAFSRDQRRKCYVQDRIVENAAHVYRWIEDGAAIYVCGDARNMAGDVHEALLGVLEAEAQIDRDTAERRLRELRSCGHYQRDVY